MSDNFNIQSKNHDTRDGTAFALQHSGLSPRAMSTLPKTLTLDTSTSRANPTPQPMKRLTVPRIRQRKGGEPLVMLTAYTLRQAQPLDPHCDMLLVGASLAQVISGLPHTAGEPMAMMALPGAAVVR